MLTGEKPVQQQGYLKLGRPTRNKFGLELFLFSSLGVPWRRKVIFKSDCSCGLSLGERRAVHTSSIGYRCSGNWVVRVGEYLLSKRKPPRRLRALTPVCCFGRACKSLLFFVGVSDALELVSSSIAGGHTEEIATGKSEDCR